jgi:hypothetical protein
MPWRIILRDNEPHSCDGKLLFGIIFCSFCDGVFKLLGWVLPSGCRRIKLFDMSRRIVLRHHGSYGSDRRLCSGLILSRVVNRLLKLFIGNLFVICIFDELLELSGGLISSLHGIDSLFCMPWGVILRDNGSHSCDGKLLFGILFCSFCNGVFKLSRWDVPSNSRFIKLFGMSRRIVLRHLGSYGSDRHLCSGLLLIRVCNGLLKLFIGNLFICIFN